MPNFADKNKYGYFDFQAFGECNEEEFRASLQPKKYLLIRYRGGNSFSIRLFNMEPFRGACYYANGAIANPSDVHEIQFLDTYSYHEFDVPENGKILGFKVVRDADPDTPLYFMDAKEERHGQQ